MNGITRGYLKSSPFEAFTLAIITHTTFIVRRMKIIGIPTIIIQRGIVRIIYRSIDN
jgi:hypothetical protein